MNTHGFHSASLAVGMFGWLGLNVFKPQIVLVVYEAAFHTLYASATIYAAYLASASIEQIASSLRHDFQKMGKPENQMNTALGVVMGAASIAGAAYLLYNQMQYLKTRVL